MDGIPTVVVSGDGLVMNHYVRTPQTAPDKKGVQKR